MIKARTAIKASMSCLCFLEALLLFPEKVTVSLGSISFDTCLQASPKSAGPRTDFHHRTSQATADLRLYLLSSVSSSPGEPMFRVESRSSGEVREVSEAEAIAVSLLMLLLETGL